MISDAFVNSSACQQKRGAFTLDRKVWRDTRNAHIVLALRVIPSLSPLSLVPMSRTPYRGTSRKLVLAFDIGTTYSGAAYAFLDPDEVPQIVTVTK